jgi:hypothetical protein
MLQTKFGDHPSISSVVGDVKMFFLFLALATNQSHISKFYKRPHRNATDKSW